MLCWNSLCEHENLPDAEYCEECGATLALHDRYYAIRVLGEGGFGKVFLAEDSYGRRYAVKRTHEHRKELSNEAAILELLKNEGRGGVPKEEELVSEAGDMFLVMELIEGHPLHRSDSDEEVSSQNAHEFLREMLSILEVLEKENVVHGDIKPENIIITRDHHYSLIDFGSALDLEHTRLPLKWCEYTEGYAPVEQRLMNPTLSSDIYALGSTVIELLIGDTPYDIRQGSNDSDLLIEERLLGVGVSAAFVRILMKMVAENQLHRYHSAKEIEGDLDSLGSRGKKGRAHKKHANAW